MEFSAEDSEHCGHDIAGVSVGICAGVDRSLALFWGVGHAQLSVVSHVMVGLVMVYLIKSRLNVSS